MLPRWTKLAIWCVAVAFVAVIGGRVLAQQPAIHAVAASTGVPTWAWGVGAGVVVLLLAICGALARMLWQLQTDGLGREIRELRKDLKALHARLDAAKASHDQRVDEHERRIMRLEMQVGMKGGG